MRMSEKVESKLSEKEKSSVMKEFQKHHEEIKLLSLLEKLAKKH